MPFSYPGSTAAENVADPESQEVPRVPRERLPGQPRVQEAATGSSATYRYNGSRRTTVQRSSSINPTSQPNPEPRVARHHSVATADTSPPDGNRPRRENSGGQGRQRMPPILIRGGYLQSQLDGPTIPVYTLQGSNEAYISLTDLPSLQMPSLDSVPAFIPELPEPLPDEEPPPYSLQPGGYPGRAEVDEVSSQARGEERSDPQEVNNNEVISTAMTTSQRGEAVVGDGDTTEANVASRESLQSGDWSMHPQSALTNVEAVSEDISHETGEPGQGSPGDAEALDATRNRRKVKSIQRKPSREINTGDTTTAVVGRSVLSSDQNTDGIRVSPVQREGRDLESKAKNKDVGVKKRDSQKAVRAKETGLSGNVNHVSANQVRAKETGRSGNINHVSANQVRAKETGRSGNINHVSANQGTGQARGKKEMGSVGKPTEEELRGKKMQRRKMPVVPEVGSTKTVEEKKHRIKEQVLSSSKNIPGDRKQHLSSPTKAMGENNSGEPSPKAKATKVKPNLTREGSEDKLKVPVDRKSNKRQEKGAKMKTSRKSPKDVDRALKMEKNPDASSRESLSEMISLLESVRRSTGEGKPDKKARKKQRSPLDDMNFPDTKV